MYIPETNNVHSFQIIFGKYFFLGLEFGEFRQSGKQNNPIGRCMREMSESQMAEMERSNFVSGTLTGEMWNLLLVPI
jgi:hypothetical protein